MALGASSALHAAAKPPLVMAPASPWVIARAEDSCAVQRTFQAGEKQLLLELREFGPGGRFQVTIGSDTLHTAPGSPAPRVRFNPGDEPVKADSAFFFHHGRTDGVLFGGSIWLGADKEMPSETGQADAVREARELAITGIEVDAAFEQDLTLQTGRLFGPMADLRDCGAELLRRWGMDADVQQTLSRPPQPLDWESWAPRVAAIYPQEQLAAGRTGLALIRLIVGVDGKPTKCITNKDAPDHVFDQEACRIVMHFARFEPALDAKGAPTEGFWSTTVYYMLGRH